MARLLEVIACSADDAVEAEQGGAGRLEVINRFDLGGLTPSLELVSEIRSKVSIPLRVMLREHEGYALRSKYEKHSLIAIAKQLSDSGADGVVLGFLKGNELDLDLTAEILAECPDLRATFHHAFEETPDKRSAIKKLKQLPKIDRILSHAGAGEWSEKFERLEQYADSARPSIEIIAGGGIDLPSIRLLRAQTTITEFHVGTAARTGGRIDRKKVRQLVKSIEE